MPPTAIPSTDRNAGPVVAASGRADHPATQGRPDRSDDDPSGALSFRALRAIATGFARVQPPVPLGVNDPSVPRSVRLLATAYYDVWLITWPEGSGLQPHDHGGVRSVLHVIDGELVEIVADHVDHQLPRARMLRRGDTLMALPSSIHDLANRSGAEATTLHVYSPPLAEISFLDLVTDSEHLRTQAVAEQLPSAGAGASASDAAPLGPPPLALVEG